MTGTAEPTAKVDIRVNKTLLARALPGTKLTNEGKLY